MIYEMNVGTGKLTPIDDSGKENLEIGRVLKLNGYNNPEFVIVGPLNEHRMYPVIGREDFRRRNYELFALKFISEKKDGRIQTYITDEIADPFEVAHLIRESIELFNRETEEKTRKAQELERLEKIGREIAKQKIPESVPALIVAEYREDESDSQSDYFSSRGAKLVVLAVSTHKRDIFSELRKAALRFPETKHLGIENPRNEHREKYSMGHGFYLGEHGYNSTGWKIQKRCRYGREDWGQGIYVSLAKGNTL